MKKFVIPFLAVFIPLFVCNMALAIIYRWVDEKGVVHLSDTPPPGFGKKVKGQTLPTYYHGPPAGSESPGASRGAKGGTDSPAAYGGDKPIPTNMPKVELFTTRSCPYCDQAREFFRSRGIPFKEYDVERDRDAARRKQRLDPRKGVPLAVINGKVIYGYSANEYARALKERS